MARDRARNNLNQSRLVTLTSTLKTFKDFVGLADKNDIYRYSVGDRSRLDVNLTGLGKQANVDIEILQIKGNKTSILKRLGKFDFSQLRLSDRRRNFTSIFKSSKKGRSNEVFSTLLEAGEYYLRVYRRTGNTVYNLALALTPELVSTGGSSGGNGGSTSGGSTSGGSTSGGSTSVSSLWTKQFGTTANDYPYGVAVSGNSTYIVGGTNGTFPGNTSLGKQDAFIASYNSTTGQQQWIKQPTTAELGTANDDLFSSVAVDGTGNIYAAGIRDFSSSIPGKGDGYLVKYNSDGTPSWQKSFGSNSSTFAGNIELAAGVAVNGTDVYVAGVKISTFFLPPSAEAKPLIIRYDANGNQINLTGDITNIVNKGAISGIAVNGNGDVYVTGITYETVNFAALSSSSLDNLELGNLLTGENVFVAKYNSSGQKQWLTTLDSADQKDDYARGLAIDSQGNVYVTGETSGALPSGSLPANTNAGGVDAFVARFDAATGSLQWLKQFGTANADQGQGIAVDSDGNPYITGEVQPLGTTNTQGFFAKYKGADGSLLFEQQIGSDKADEGNSITVDSAKNVYVTGQTFGNLGATNAGAYDAWVEKYAPLTP